MISPPSEQVFPRALAEQSLRGLHLLRRRVEGTEVFVRPFPDVQAGRWQVSTGGGNLAVMGA